LTVKVRIEIDCGNAAFEENYYGELARIIYEAASRIELLATNGSPIILYDINGNRCGTVTALE